VGPVSTPVPDRPMAEDAPASPGGRPEPPEADLAREVQALAALLAEVVELAGKRAVFPGHWQHLAELAMDHPSVRAALLADAGTGVVSSPGGQR
jgi:hypothetical protein